METPYPTPDLPVKKDRKRKTIYLADLLAEKLIKMIAFVSFAVILLIFIFVFREALPIFTSSDQVTSGEVLQSETYGDDPAASNETMDAGKETSASMETAGAEGEVSWKNILFSMEWQPVSGKPRYGLLPLFIGSLKVTLIAVFIAAPLAILAALFSAAFASRRLKEIIKPAIELLAGFPSVVIGFFALVTLATFLQQLFGVQYRLNAFVGGVALSLAVIPIIYTVAEDAISSVPKSMSEASLALGASKWQTALFVIVPAATPGIFAALLLGFGRAFGETMIVLMATGNAALSSLNLFEPVRTMSATIGAEMAEVVFGDTHYNVLFLIGVLLFVITFSLNAIAEFYVRKRLLKRFRGE
jgi:phosphate transport system permease protein